MIDRRSFLSLLTPLAVLPVVGPHMLLSERPKVFGWTKAIEVKYDNPVWRLEMNGYKVEWTDDLAKDLKDVYGLDVVETFRDILEHATTANQYPDRTSYSLWDPKTKYITHPLGFHGGRERQMSVKITKCGSQT